VVAGFAGGLNVVELTGAARPDPRLALSRRCARAGRLWARLLARDLAAVRRVDFKLGSRLVRRDPRAPFTATVGPRMLQRARTRSLRAVVQLRDSARARAVLRRTLPRCVR
jgi:hypothetical protein